MVSRRSDLDGVLKRRVLEIGLVVDRNALAGVIAPFQ
jgi:hypothetical protein